ncbi:aspartate beta-hydroxylase domain-containing protein 2-like [Saccoglossus kowalevskii]|uniref:Aspartate beta-hydroxylase domain-containing protein 2-like n=1 Tax=Saccoglossus kowalevskii TaxID=10224 RepID=A0ABM0GJI0_SACKO|nr:PREDICTED: aspartate beta-hydroxylase domain-containing protein 2-like [Saccoglossus kowalevskii]
MESGEDSPLSVLCELSIQIGTLLAIIVGALLLKRVKWFLPVDANVNDIIKDIITTTEEYSNCESPSCIRCQKYRELHRNLLPRLEEFAKMHSWHGLERILSGCEEAEIHRKAQEVTLQQPNVFFLPGLFASPWHENVQKRDVRRIKGEFPVILRDFESIYREHQSGNTQGWTVNNVPTGEWSVFYLINQGIRNADNCRKCPKTAHIIDQLESIMEDTVFGNVVFSVLQPGSHITEHYGPCNLRIRCHLGLIVPPKCHLTVAGETRCWVQGECFTFDDSFLHEARHDGKRSDGPRVVFMVDLWHPDVTELEKKVLKTLFKMND